MHRILIAAVLVISFSEHSNGYCCFRDPLMLAPKCGCPDFYAPSGVVKCSETCANPQPNPCGCSQPASKPCGCSQPASKPCGCIQPAYKPCGCSQSPCSNAPCSCQSTCASKYDYAQYLGPNICGSRVPACSCYRDTSNVCYVCEEPSPMCSCLKAANKGGCSKAKSDCGCGCEDMKSIIYFPEVEYPLVALDMKPYYYGGCYTY